MGSGQAVGRWRFDIRDHEIGSYSRCPECLRGGGGTALQVAIVGATARTAASRPGRQLD